MESAICGIFDNETEPLFNVKPFELSSVVLDDCLFVLGTENVDNVERTCRLQGHFKNGPVVSLVIQLCDRLKQPAEVKYHAIELFDVFMMEHIRYLRRYVQDRYGSRSNSSVRLSKGVKGHMIEETEVQRQWRVILKRVKNQVLLRVLSCIQIASKLVMQPKAMLTMDAMEQVLRRAGFRFGKTSIKKSELRILDTVGYRTTVPTPVVYVETLIEILGRNDAMINLRALHYVALKVLDLFYLQRKQIYRELFLRTTTEKEEKKEKKKKRGENDCGEDDERESNFLPVTNDIMFASTAVVSCAAYLLDPLTYTNLTQQLHLITRIPHDEIMDLTIVLVRIALSSPSSPPHPQLPAPPDNSYIHSFQNQLQIFHF